MPVMPTLMRPAVMAITLANVSSPTPGATHTEPKVPTVAHLLKISDQEAVIADGPLSQAITQVLDKMYAKEIDPNTGVSLETQAIDSSINAKLWLAARQQTDQFKDYNQPVGMLYAVQRHNVRMADVLNVIDAVAQMSPEEKINSAVVIEVPENEVAMENDNAFAASLHEMAQANGLSVYPSLNAYLKMRYQAA